MRFPMILGLIALAATSAAAPIPFQLEQGLITVPVTVGAHRLPLMLDLGDFRAISLSTAVLDSVPVSFTGETHVFADYNGNRLEARRFLVREASLGPIRHRNLSGSEDVMDPSNLSPNPYGAVGRGFFEGRLLTIDYPGRTISVDEPPLARAVVLPLDTSSGMLRVSAEVDGRPLTLLVDTGAQTSVVTPEALPETEKALGEYSAYRAGSITVDGHDLGETVLLRLPLGVPDFDGILGADVLGRSVLQVDLNGGELRLAAP
ncbi:hypothetical protein KDK88_05010 [bacterium]|nr:hypothetical protein [bacterium]